MSGRPLSVQLSVKTTDEKAINRQLTSFGTSASVERLFSGTLKA